MFEQKDTENKQMLIFSLYKKIVIFSLRFMDEWYKKSTWQNTVIIY